MRNLPKTGKPILPLFADSKLSAKRPVKFPVEIRRQNPTVPWQEMTAMRNKLIHEYFGG